MEVSIRQISKEDAPAISILCSQLGYSLSIEQILENIAAVLENKFHDAFVAVHKDKIIGWIGVAQAFQIESPSRLGFLLSMIASEGRYPLFRIIR